MRKVLVVERNLDKCEKDIKACDLSTPQMDSDFDYLPSHRRSITGD